jgi:hypothetical protein
MTTAMNVTTPGRAEVDGLLLLSRPQQQAETLTTQWDLRREQACRQSSDQPPNRPMRSGNAASAGPETAGSAPYSLT